MVWLFPAGSVDDFVDAMENCLAADLERLSKMGESGYRRVIERHAIDAEAAKLAALFRVAGAAPCGGSLGLAQHECRGEEGHERQRPKLQRQGLAGDQQAVGQYDHDHERKNAPPHQVERCGLVSTQSHHLVLRRTGGGQLIGFSDRPTSSGVKLPLPGTSAIASLLGVNRVALEAQPSPAPCAHCSGPNSTRWRNGSIH